MTYALDTSHTSPNQTSAANCPAAFGYPRNIIGITIHHWDAKGSGANWDGTLATLLNDYRNPGSRGVSAHFMAETGRVACLVFPGDAAWHAGNPQGNAQTIGIELNPDESNGTYQTAAELIAQIWVDWGIPHKLYHHYEWTSTGCPGSYDLDRLGRMAETEYTKLTKGGVKGQSTTVTPIKEDTLSAAEVKQITDAVAASEKRVRDYVAALLVNQWSDGKNTHPGIGLVVEENQRRINAISAKVSTPAPVTLTDEQVQQIIAAIPLANLAALKEQLNK